MTVVDSGLPEDGIGGASQELDEESGASRLWQKVREERGLAYSVGASTAMYNDTGFFTVSA